MCSLGEWGYRTVWKSNLGLGLLEVRLEMIYSWVFSSPALDSRLPSILEPGTEECIVLAWSDMILQHEEGGLMAVGHSRDRWQCILKGCDEEREREMVRSQLHMLACQEGGGYDMSTIEAFPSLAQGTREAALSL